VDFQLSEDQQALRAGIRSFCDGRISIDALRELEKQGFDRALWGELAEMGVFSLRQDESAGGVGLAARRGARVRELGRRPRAGSARVEPSRGGTRRGRGPRRRVVGAIEQLRTSNDPVLVEHLDQLDALLCLRKDGVYHVDPKSLSAKSAGTPLDPFTPIFSVASLPQGERVGDAALGQKLRLEGAAFAAAQLLGIAEMTQELATEYAKKREQFDRRSAASRRSSTSWPTATRARSSRAWRPTPRARRSTSRRSARSRARSRPRS
jgi:hypothetical protein